MQENIDLVLRLVRTSGAETALNEIGRNRRDCDCIAKLVGEGAVDLVEDIFQHRRHARNGQLITHPFLLFRRLRYSSRLMDFRAGAAGRGAACGSAVTSMRPILISISSPPRGG